MRPAMGELEVIVTIVAIACTQHHAVKACVVVKATQHTKAQPRAIHQLSPWQIADGTGYAKVVLHEIYSCRLIKMKSAAQVNPSTYRPH